MILFEHVTKTYNNNVKALDDVSFHIRKGDFVFVVGHSGAGKSTLTKLILHEEQPDTGYIRVGDFDVTKLSRKMVPYLRRSMVWCFRISVCSQTRRFMKILHLPWRLSAQRSGRFAGGFPTYSVWWD